MIVVPCAFGAILNDWLASLGLSRPSAAPRGVALSLEQWEAQVHAAIALAPGPARGLDIGRHVRLQHVGPLGYLLVNTRTLSEFFETYLLLDQWFVEHLNQIDRARDPEHLRLNELSVLDI